MVLAERFSTNAEIHSLVSHEFKKSISLIDKEGFVYMPHYESEEYEVIKELALIIKENRTLLRYLDLNEIIDLAISHVLLIVENKNGKIKRTDKLFNSNISFIEKEV